MKKTIKSIAAAIVVVFSVNSWAQDITADNGLHSAITLAKKSVMQDIELAGDRLIVVGSFGQILMSDDQGMSWDIADTPIDYGLTAVSFPTVEVGYAIGHRGVVLKTLDGGDSWQQIMDGARAAQITRESLPEGIEDDFFLNATRLQEEGADKPFLDLTFDTAQHGIIVGAYGLGLETFDGGESWHSIFHQSDNPSGYHFYSIESSTDGGFLIVGEFGGIYYRKEGGDEFKGIDSPYEGTFFGQLQLEEGALIYGLRGHVFQSGAIGWQRCTLPTQATITAATQLRDQTILLAAANGQLLRGDYSECSFNVLDTVVPPMVTDLVQTSGGKIVLTSMEGVKSISLSAE